jgi:CubicO group peptidase (beta-lactamase class C family)
MSSAASTPMNDISQFLRSRIEAGDFPSAVYLVAEKGEIVLHDALGHVVVEPDLYEARNDTIYDLASLTKVLVTGLVAARLVEEGLISLDHPVQRYAHAFVAKDKSQITILDLLAHTSGLAGWLPFYRLTDDPRLIVDVIAKRPLEYVPRSRVVYSDPNFIILQEVIEKATGTPIDRLFTEQVVDKLTLKRTFFNPPTLLKPQIAASENGNKFEAQACKDLGFDGTFNPQPSTLRPQTIWGEVHDGNAWFMGGVAGHAGLFSTAEEVCKIASQFLPGHSQLLRPETCELFRTNLTPGMNEHRSFAFQLASSPDSTAGVKMPPASFGHTGFTGTSLWIDPANERIFILLTNRTHIHDIPFVNINSVRRRFHDMAIDLLDGET